MAARGLFSSADDLQRDQLTYPDVARGKCDIKRPNIAQPRDLRGSHNPQRGAEQLSGRENQ
jgi:hypothetical protein